MPHDADEWKLIDNLEFVPSKDDDKSGADAETGLVQRTLVNLGGIREISVPGEARRFDWAFPVAVVTGIASIVAAWIQGRNGRKVVIEAGGIKVEANSPEEAKDLFDHIKAQRLPSKGR
ncbi:MULTISPECIES: hypothetical protein [Burkholderia cepacia complex]|uniref:hypothetical protein n=1 Tax=Burkholderia cepacia complex TaxID=87882 RepID=UPI001CB3371D|nr:hypothetical protein [Burkholderia cepacia]CAG9273396.1 hypothetical protein BCEP4_800042 [Burkholderia cepacia]